MNVRKTRAPKPKADVAAAMERFAVTAVPETKLEAPTLVLEKVGDQEVFVPTDEAAKPKYIIEPENGRLGLRAEGVGRQPLVCENYTDANGNPTGGLAIGVGFEISWQYGPTRDPETLRKVPQTGAFVEDVAQAIIQRIEFYQGSKFASPFNEAALDHFRRGLVALESRRRDREARGVDGLHLE